MPFALKVKISHFGPLSNLSIDDSEVLNFYCIAQYASWGKIFTIAKIFKNTLFNIVWVEVDQIDRLLIADQSKFWWFLLWRLFRLFDRCKPKFYIAYAIIATKVLVQKCLDTRRIWCTTAVARLSYNSGNSRSRILWIVLGTNYNFSKEYRRKFVRTIPWKLMDHLKRTHFNFNEQRWIFWGECFI